MSQKIFAALCEALNRRKIKQGKEDGEDDIKREDSFTVSAAPTTVPSTLTSTMSSLVSENKYGNMLFKAFFCVDVA